MSSHIPEKRAVNGGKGFSWAPFPLDTFLWAGKGKYHSKKCFKKMGVRQVCSNRLINRNKNSIIKFYIRLDRTISIFVVLSLALMVLNCENIFLHHTLNRLLLKEKEVFHGLDH